VDWVEETIRLEELSAVEADLDELAEMLVEVVDDGASIGFLPPMKRETAKSYWASVLQPGVILYVARVEGKIAGSVQVHLCAKENGNHRAEIAKLMTHPAFRRRGIARSLMRKAEERAKQENRILLVLDTREGDPSNLLYRSLGFTEAGRIPDFAQSGDGSLDATVFYYKRL
jgi:ribosomal protein S18 acetylase RimI-like enzyme